jgi:hypothetical protein
LTSGLSIGVVGWLIIGGIPPLGLGTVAELTRPPAIAAAAVEARTAPGAAVGCP